MVDHETTTDADMTPGTTPAIGTATVPTTTMEPAQAPIPSSQAPVPPPLSTEPIDKVLRWIANVTSMAGQPDAIDIMLTTMQVDVAAPNDVVFARWQAIIGAVTKTTLGDALGATICATTVYPDRWWVTIHAHIRTTS
jgi:hypothetical protein